MDALLSSIVSQYFEKSPDVLVLDGINALPQTREAVSSLYRVFQGVVIAIGEEQIGGSHFAYAADTLLEVRQIFARGARYRLLRVVKTRLGPGPGAEFYFTITGSGVRITRKWSRGAMGDKSAAAPSGRRVAFSEEITKALTSARPVYKRPGLLAGNRVGVFLYEDPLCMKLAAAYLCDYMNNVRVGVISMYPFIGDEARRAGCEPTKVIVPTYLLSKDYALDEAIGKLDNPPVVSIYGLEDVLWRFGPERVSYLLDFVQTVLPESAILATFRGVDPSPELLDIFNTVWRYEPNRAEVVKSALGWPFKELKIVEEGGRIVLTKL